MAAAQFSDSSPWNCWACGDCPLCSQFSLSSCHSSPLGRDGRSSAALTGRRPAAPERGSEKRKSDAAYGPNPSVLIGRRALIMHAIADSWGSNGACEGHPVTRQLLLEFVEWPELEAVEDVAQCCGCGDQQQVDG